MTEENKNLLLQELSARLPYGVKICYIYNGEECISTIEKIDTFGYIWDNYNGCYHVREIKPYLFPISSMTEEQKKEYCSLQQKVIYNSKGLINSDVMEYVNWCYKNHIDINNLIPVKLALDASGLNIY